MQIQIDTSCIGHGPLMPWEKNAAALDRPSPLGGASTRSPSMAPSWSSQSPSWSSQSPQGSLLSSGSVTPRPMGSPCMPRARLPARGSLAVPSPSMSSAMRPGNWGAATAAASSGPVRALPMMGMPAVHESGRAERVLRDAAAANAPASLAQRPSSWSRRDSTTAVPRRSTAERTRASSLPRSAPDQQGSKIARDAGSCPLSPSTLDSRQARGILAEHGQSNAGSAHPVMESPARLHGSRPSSPSQSVQRSLLSPPSLGSAAAALHKRQVSTWDSTLEEPHFLIGSQRAGASTSNSALQSSGNLPPVVPTPSLEEKEDMALQTAILQSLQEGENSIEEKDPALQAAIRLSLQEDSLRDEKAFDEAVRQSLQEHAPILGNSKVAKLRHQDCASAMGRLAQTFEHAQWLNDASISYGFDQLIQEQENKAALATDVLFLDPATSFWFACHEVATDLIEARSSFRMQDKLLVLCPVTDSENPNEADSGTHWSLLVCWRGSATADWRCAYYDSLTSQLRAVKALQKAASLAERLLGRTVPVEFGSCAQQTNSYDCGVYVLMFSRIILDSVQVWQRSGHSLYLGPWSWELPLQQVTPEQVENHRLFLRHRILSSCPEPGLRAP
eukprot:TRINITY_DN88093_c0_g1_i1.p1 TRINITY_DN88093_c0_g1~~TRINITY_DN88093_c0_g1_i1.p1  ORF type:complete len:617 (-),score=79.93 TRINITY_DN88093_c0_g1_i1:285-2135(-)